eukprot:1166483-Prorocentrum_minimum.AAC.1
MSAPVVAMSAPVVATSTPAVVTSTPAVATSTPVNTCLGGRQAESSLLLRTAQAEMEEFLMNNPAPVMTLDRDGTILRWSPSAVKETGYTQVRGS